MGEEANAFGFSHMDLLARGIILGIPPTSPGSFLFEERKTKNRILGKC